MTSAHIHSTLADLEQRDEFIGRHIGPDDLTIPAMLKVVGADTLDDLIA